MRPPLAVPRFGGSSRASLDTPSCDGCRRGRRRSPAGARATPSRQAILPDAPAGPPPAAARPASRSRCRRVPRARAPPRGPRAPFSVASFPLVLVLLLGDPLARRHPPRAVQPPLASRERPGPGADHRRGRPRIAAHDRRVLRACRLVARPVHADLPRSFWPIEALLTVTFLGGSRFAIRAGFEHAHAGTPVASSAPLPTLLYGAGETGVLLVRSARHHPGAGVLPGRLPRRRSEPQGRGHRRPPGLRGPRRHGVGRCRDRREEPADHDAERPGSGGAAGGRGRVPPAARGSHGPGRSPTSSTAASTPTASAACAWRTCCAGRW